MYGDHMSGDGKTPLRGNVAIDPIPSHEGQMFKADLEDRFNPEGASTVNAQYRLQIGLRKTLIPAVVKSDGTIQRYDVRFDSDFRLYKIGVAAPIYVDKMRRSGSYNVAVNANFATYEAEQDVIERTLQELAEDYIFRITGYLAGKPKDPLPDKVTSAIKKPMQSTPASALTLAPQQP